ncbi:PDR/VanB family oxidoreductase [Streptomyces uncialis]|uniref:PDR/VanB family oxidoreductase n=1 Tax=Streptomyces uncialis TaxID=1048205 RepID=UPI0037FDAE75
MPGPRLPLAALAATGSALLVRRALRRRIGASPLWPLPALEEPVSGRPRSRALRLLVTRHERIADGVVLLRLEGAALPRWEPGAHLDLVLPSGRVRSYSLCGDPADRTAYTVAVRLVPDGRGGSREAHELLRVGSEVEVRGPRNRFPLADAPDHVLVAGGIGITPLLPMLRALDAAGTPWRLLYRGRGRASMPFLDEIERLDAGRGRVTVSDGPGRPPLEALFRDVVPGTAVHICGPAGLMDAVAGALPAGCAPHRERFTASVEPGGDDTEFEVELRRSGRTVRVPADSTALAAVRAVLPDTPYSCEQGFCGTCRQRVLDGRVDHRDTLLTDAERAESMLLCVSRARGGRLALDL